MPAFTDSQREAIQARGNVLVLAGAGAGKTRTLVERCIAWLLEDPAHSLDAILMVTFTDAAAAEMRHRIRTELEKRLFAHPEDERLAEQLALLETAAISTLHSFCYQLVRQHFYQLELDPQVMVMAEEEVQLLVEETLTSLLEHYYADPTPKGESVRHLIQTHSRGWDRPIRRLILRLHRYIQTLPNSKSWIAEELQSLARSEPVHWQQQLRQAIDAWRRSWLPILQEEPEENLVAHQGIRVLEKLSQEPSRAEMEAAIQTLTEAIRNAPKGRKGKGYWARQFEAEVEFLNSLSLKGKDDPLLEDWNWVRSSLTVLLELTADFGREFAREKRELGVIDFNDLEQFSLELLWDPTKAEPTALAREWRKKFKLIFVDEYQDINAAQDSILAALGCDGGEANRFLVGDIKQSIYRFRLAAPHIFQNYARLWSGNEANSQVIALSDNFRSHEGILNFVNPFFAALMRDEIGGVDYDAAAWLKFGNRNGRTGMSIDAAPTASDQGENPAPQVELLLRLVGKNEKDTAEIEDGEGTSDDARLELSRAEQEARMVGLHLIEMRRKKVTAWMEKEDARRAVDWRDMVILLRSPKKKVESYAKEFARLGIPLLASRGGFFDSPEVSDLLQLLSLLDNPLQDIPVLAVLRSPLVGLSLDELTVIRLTSRGRFWLALHHFHREAKQAASGQNAPPAPGDNDRAATEIEAAIHSAWPKIDLFLRSFRTWRRLARETSLSQCLEKILNDTHYSAWLVTQSDDHGQRTNIPKLLNWARQFDQFHRQGLYRFLRFIEAQQQAEIDHDPAPVETENAVRLMSVHQSKGLEFPVVVVADLGKPFNFADLHDDIILDEVHGLCPQVKPPFTERRYPSLPYWLAQRRQRREALGEEMRLFYVAMTRACNILILAGTAARKNTDRWRKGTLAEHLQTQDILAARNWLDWLGTWLCAAIGQPEWTSLSQGATPLLRWRIYEEQDVCIPTPQGQSENDDSSSLSQKIDPKALKALLDRLYWQYPFLPATHEPAKASVSVLRRRATEDLPEEASQLFVPRTTINPPSGNKLTAAETGTIHHLFLQFLSLHQVHDLESLRAEADRLMDEGLFSEFERNALDLAAIAQFWNSETGTAILAQKAFVHRELSFTARIPLSDIVRLRRPAEALSAPPAKAKKKKKAAAAQPDLPFDLPSIVSENELGIENEFIIVQGVIDLAVLLPNEIWLLDFKTDRTSKTDWIEKVKFYEPQIRLYAQALSQIYKRPVTRRWLHFLSIQKTVACLS